MTFFLIVPSVMVISILLIHAIINRLGLRIHYVTLMMCAFLAIAADLGAIAFSDVPNKFYFVRLTGFIFVAALMTTATNWFLVKRELAEEEKFSEQVKLAYQKETEKVFKEEEIPKVKEVSEKVVEPVLIEEIESVAQTEVESTKKVDLVKPAKIKTEIKQVEKVQSEPIPKVEPIQPKEVKEINSIIENTIQNISNIYPFAKNLKIFCKK